MGTRRLVFNLPRATVGARGAHPTSTRWQIKIRFMKRIIKPLGYTFAAVGFIGGTIGLALNPESRESVPIWMVCLIGIGLIAYGILEIRAISEQNRRK